MGPEFKRICLFSKREMVHLLPVRLSLAGLVIFKEAVFAHFCFVPDSTVHESCFLTLAVQMMAPLSSEVKSLQDRVEEDPAGCWGPHRQKLAQYSRQYCGQAAMCQVAGKG